MPLKFSCSAFLPFAELTMRLGGCRPTSAPSQQAGAEAPHGTRCYAVKNELVAWVEERGGKVSGVELVKNSAEGGWGLQAAQVISSAGTSCLARRQLAASSPDTKELNAYFAHQSAVVMRAPRRRPERLLGETRRRTPRRAARMDAARLTHAAAHPTRPPKLNAPTAQQDAAPGTRLIELPAACHLTYGRPGVDTDDDPRLLALIEQVPAELWGARLALKASGGGCLHVSSWHKRDPCAAGNSLQPWSCGPAC